MSKKIIHLTKEEDGGMCLLCSRRHATLKMNITRLIYDDNVISFYLCDGCLAQMQKDIETCE